MVRELLQLNTIHKKIIITLFGVLMLLVVAYGALISRVVMQTMAHNDIDNTLALTTSDVAVLEAQYMDLIDALTLSRARSLGFVETGVALFVSRRADTFSFRTEVE